MGNESAKSAAGASAPSADNELHQVKANISRMDGAIRRKLRGGVQYNMRVVIRGKRKTGKSALCRRLQGLSFHSEYMPTPQIESGTINWSFKDTDEAVKVEVWDVVDEAIAPSATPSPRKVGGPPAAGSGALDASVIDVYKGTQACIFMVDPFDRSSYEYVEEHLQSLPSEIICLILVNFRDRVRPPATAAAGGAPAPGGGREAEDGAAAGAGAARVVGLDEVRLLAQKFQAEKKHVDVFETSMLNCYGMKVLYHHFCIPFLKLKRKTLEDQILRTQEQMEAAKKDLGLFIASNDYADYIERVQASRPEVAQGRQPPSMAPLRPAALHGATGESDGGEGPPAAAAAAAAAAASAAARGWARRRRRGASTCPGAEGPPRWRSTCASSSGEPCWRRRRSGRGRRQAQRRVQMRRKRRRKKRKRRSWALGPLVGSRRKS